jgi:CubicO group peptidase (beta-lactamase class C family)
MKPDIAIPFCSASSFGSPGAYGAMGFADSENGIGYVYVTSSMGTTFTGDPSDLVLRNEVYSIIRNKP